MTKIAIETLSARFDNITTLKISIECFCISTVRELADVISSKKLLVNLDLKLKFESKIMAAFF